MKWLRLWHDARTDAKLRSLSDAEHRVWFSCLLFASEQEYRGSIPASNMEVLAAEVGASDVAVLESTLRKLVRLSILHEDAPGSLRFTNWDKRQFGSDCSTARTRTFRERSRNVSETPEERAQNDSASVSVSESVSDSSLSLEDTSIDTGLFGDTRAREESDTAEADFEQCWQALPKESRVGKQAARKRFAKIMGLPKRDRPTVEQLRTACAHYAESVAMTGYHAKNASTFLGPDDHWREYIGDEWREAAEAVGRKRAGYGGNGKPAPTIPTLPMASRPAYNPMKGIEECIVIGGGDL